ncbi:MAG: hypothetical protein JXM73_17030 [Anaerolineae bacterium]|nr:hypothetical protein [Anaerolineae bacterium]
MDFAEFKRRLQSHPTFRDLARWTMADPGSGLTSPNRYRFQCGDRDYFVKEVKANERRILAFLTGYRLEIAPRVVLPELLEQDIAVTDYVRGVPLKSKTLPETLIRNYALMQNILNQHHVFERAEAFRGCTFTSQDDGFYRSSITRCIDQGYENLLGLRAYDLPVVEAFVEIADHIRAYRVPIIDDYAGIPFGWLHHDFREDQIIGDPPKLIDWGSSYGHGPFLFDLAPFLVNDEPGLAAFIAHSDICRSARRAEIARWLYAANCASFAAFALWRLSDFGYASLAQSRESCRALLETEYPAYRPILDHVPGQAGQHDDHTLV